MKKTFKHKTTGQEATLVSDPQNVTTKCYSVMIRKDVGIYDTFMVPAIFIENSPDWVEEKDFVITAFRNMVGKVFERKSDGLFWSDIGIEENSLLNEGFCVKTGDIEIFSVLSNGIEWKLQDKSEQGEIEKFTISNKDEMFAITSDWMGDISLLTPAKKVILTQTEIVNALDKLSIDINNLITKLNEK